MSPSDNPFVALDRIARKVCLAEVEDFTGRLPPHPFVVRNRREEARHEAELLARRASKLAAQLGIFQDLERRLLTLGGAVCAVMNAMGHPWSRVDYYAPADACRELLRRVESCREASAAVGRLVHAHLPPGAAPDSCGAGPLPPTWDELIQRLREQLGNFPSDASDTRNEQARTEHARGAGADRDQGKAGKAEGAEANRSEKQAEGRQTSPAEGTGTGRDQGGAGQNQGGGVTPAQREEQIRRMTPAIRLAYLSFKHAEKKKEKFLEDREAHEVLKDEDFAEDVGELADYQLPTFGTWARQLRHARRLLGEQKYTRRAGRPTGKSVVRQDQIERPERDD
jgi:hypothetical protein